MVVIVFRTRLRAGVDETELEGVERPHVPGGRIHAGLRPHKISRRTI